MWRGRVRVIWWWRGRWRKLGLPVWETWLINRGVPVRVLRKGGGGIVPVMPKLADGGVPKGADAGAWGEVYPQLSSWLVDSAYPDGQAIGRVQLQFTREGTVIRATLKIADQEGLKVSAVERDPASAMLALDLLLSGPDVPWERDHYPLQSPRPAKKK